MTYIGGDQGQEANHDVRGGENQEVTAVGEEGIANRVPVASHDPDHTQDHVMIKERVLLLRGDLKTVRNQGVSLTKRERKSLGAVVGAEVIVTTKRNLLVIDDECDQLIS